MEMVDRYVYAVIRRLPEKQQADIEKELRSLIEDMLSARCGEAAAKDEDTTAILTELGSPAKLAAKYRGSEMHLIGPEFYDIYLMVLKIVMIISAFGATIATVVDLTTQSGVQVPQVFGELIGSLFDGALQGFAWITIIFAVMERVNRDHKDQLPHITWKVSDLQPVPHKQAVIKPVEPIFSIIFGLIFLALFQFGNQLLGAYVVQDGTIVSIIPVFNGAFIAASMPLILGMYAVTILKESAKLIAGRWTPGLGIALALLELVAMVLALLLFANPNLWNANFLPDMRSAGLIINNVNFTLTELWSKVTRGVVIIIVFAHGIECLSSLIKGFRRSR